MGECEGRECRDCVTDDSARECVGGVYRECAWGESVRVECV